jgi:gas vesicle protein
MRTREDEIMMLSKLNKVDLLIQTIGYYDAVNNNLKKISKLKIEHKEEIKEVKESYQSANDSLSEWYNNSQSYQYVKGLLVSIEQIDGINKRLEEELKDLKENGYEDLRRENEQLRNKIVRMA